MTKKKPTIPAELPPARPLPDVVVPAPVAGLNYNEDTGDWTPAELIRATLERIDEPEPLGWVPTPPDADTPFFNEVNTDPPTPPHRCGPRDDHPHRWEALLAAAQADTAAIRKHFQVTMAGSTL